MNVLSVPSLSLRWTSADRDFWVADEAGRFAGTVDQQGSRFWVRNGFAEYLGEYRNLDDAKHALRAHLEAASSAPC